MRRRDIQQDTEKRRFYNVYLTQFWLKTGPENRRFCLPVRPAVPPKTPALRSAYHPLPKPAILPVSIYRKNARSPSIPCPRERVPECAQSPGAFAGPHPAFHPSLRTAHSSLLMYIIGPLYEVKMPLAITGKARPLLHQDHPIKLSGSAANRQGGVDNIVGGEDGTAHIGPPGIDEIGRGLDLIGGI
jgi:hypothetical protein